MAMAQHDLQQHNSSNTGKTVRPFGMRDKFGYLFGDFGNDFFFMLVSMYLMVFYTDVFGMSAALVGVLFMIARLWDAFADIAWGRFIDTRKPSKHGKFKPWILRMSIPLVITGVLMFVTIPGQSTGFYTVWAFVTYIVWGTLYSTVNIPYGSMASVITNDPIERSTLSTWRTVGSMMAKLFISATAPLLIFVNNEASADRFMLVAVIYGVLAIACYMACYKLSTERIVMPERPATEKKGSTAVTMKGLLKNKPLIAVLFASLLFMVVTMLIGAVNVYLYKNYFNNAAVLSVTGIISACTVFVVAPFIKPLIAKFGKKELASFGMIFSGLVFIGLYFVPSITTTTFVAISALGGAGYAIFNLVIWAFVTDVIDYHEYLTGLREDGTVYSVYSMARKIGQAVAGGLGGFAIAAVGYSSTLEVQTQSTLDGIYALGTLLPGAVYIVVGLTLIFFYPLNKKRLNQLTVDLAAKRQQ